jgi:hypothetical protein
MKKIIFLFLLFLLSIVFFQTHDATASSDEIVGPTTIYKQSDKILTLNNILSLYSSFYGTVLALDDNFTGSGNIVGSYDITLGIADTEYEKAITVIVKENLGNVIAVADKNILYVHKNVIISPTDILDVLVNTAFIEITASTQVTVLANEYSGNEANPDTYIFQFRIENTAGFEQEYTCHIIVENSEYLDPSIILVPEPTGFSKLWLWLKEHVNIPWDSIFFGIASISLFLIVVKMYKKKRGK